MKVYHGYPWTDKTSASRGIRLTFEFQPILEVSFQALLAFRPQTLINEVISSIFNMFNLSALPFHSPEFPISTSLRSTR